MSSRLSCRLGAISEEHECLFELQDSGDRNSPQRRAERRRAVRAALDAMPGMAGSSGGMEPDTPGEPSKPGPETEAEEFWSTGPLRCERCLALPPPVYEIGLPPWREGLPKSHQYALLINDDGARLPCFSREVRESVRWHYDHPGQRPRTTRYWCLACNYQNVQDREDFIRSWSWKNQQLGNDRHYRTIKDFAVDQFHWPRHVEFPPHKLETMAWPEADDGDTR